MKLKCSQCRSNLSCISLLVFILLHLPAVSDSLYTRYRILQCWTTYIFPFFISQTLVTAVLVLISSLLCPFIIKVKKRKSVGYLITAFVKFFRRFCAFRHNNCTENNFTSPCNSLIVSDGAFTSKRGVTLNLVNNNIDWLCRVQILKAVDRLINSTPNQLSQQHYSVIEWGLNWGNYYNPVGTPSATAKCITRSRAFSFNSLDNYYCFIIILAP